MFEAAELGHVIDEQSYADKVPGLRESLLDAQFDLVESRRFKAREAIPFKRFKITAEDWRNRDKWDEYEAAVCDMVERTSTEIAPWVLVSANDKRYARITVLKTLCHCIENQLRKS